MKKLCSCCVRRRLTRNDAIMHCRIVQDLQIVGRPHFPLFSSNSLCPLQRRSFLNEAFSKIPAVILRNTAKRLILGCFVLIDCWSHQCVLNMIYQRYTNANINLRWLQTHSSYTTSQLRIFWKLYCLWDASIIIKCVVVASTLFFSLLKLILDQYANHNRTGGQFTLWNGYEI